MFDRNLDMFDRNLHMFERNLRMFDMFVIIRNCGFDNKNNKNIE